MFSLQRWEPFRGLVRMERDLDRVFEEFFGRPVVCWAEDQVRVPTVDVCEAEDEVVVTAELPGVDRKDLEVEVMPESLLIKAGTSQQSDEKEGTVHRQERVWGRFQRTIALPVEIVADQAKALLKGGVLEVRLPKSDRTKAATPKKLKSD